MSAKNASVLSFSTLTAVLLAAALVLLNVVVTRAGARIDLTEEGLYSLSPGTEKVVAGLKDPARIRVFWGGLQAIHEPMRRSFAALLDEMADLSDGRLTVRWVDVSDKAGKDEAQEAKVPEFQFFVKVGDEQRVSRGFCSLVVESGANDPQRIDALVNRAGEFEYAVATALVYATRRNDQVVALVDASDTSGGRGGRGGRFEGLKEQLKSQYGDSLQWWHTLDQPLADNITVLLLLAPRGLQEKQVFHLEQYLLRGGKAVLCLDPFGLDTLIERPYGEGEPSGLEAWFEALGVTAGRGAAVEGDTRHWLLYPVRGERGYELLKSGYWFRVKRENCDTQNPALRDIDDFSIYWPAPLSVDGSKQAAAGRKVTVLASTSAQGMRSDDMGSLREGRTPTGLPREKVPLALLVEGALDSFWKGKPAPGEEASPSTPPSAPTGPPEATKPPEPQPAAPPPAAPAEAPKEPAKEPAPPAPPEPAPEAPREPAKEPAPGTPPGPKGAAGDPPAPGQPGPGAAPADAPKAEPPKAQPEKPEPPAPAPLPQPQPPSLENPAPDNAPSPALPAPPPPPELKHLQSGSVRFVVLGDADMLSDMLGQRSQLTSPLGWGLGVGGVAVGLNTVDWLMGDEALLSLRARDTKPRAIERPEEGTRTLLQTLNLAGVPLLAAFAGLIVFLRRRS